MLLRKWAALVLLYFAIAAVAASQGAFRRDAWERECRDKTSRWQASACANVTQLPHDQLHKNKREMNSGIFVLF